MKNNYYPFVNLPRPYDYNAMEPHIDEETILKHQNRRNDYIDNWFHVIDWEQAERNFLSE